MRCPKCKCEVGSQKQCPYCGTPMTPPEPKVPSRTDLVSRMQRQLRNLENQIRELEHKLGILLVLQGGTLAIVLLLLIAVAAK